MTDGLQCNSLQSTFGSAVHFPDDDPDFIVWDAKQQEVRSACRITPTSTQQVSEILNVLTSNWCRFAIKSGGHARNADDSVSAGGATIDLVEMKSVEFLENESWAKVGAGHTLGSLYEALEARNLSFVGGRTADVGIGGYLLGGGLSNWSPKYGLAVDNILEYEVSQGRMRLKRAFANKDRLSWQTPPLSPSTSTRIRISTSLSAAA